MKQKCRVFIYVKRKHYTAFHKPLWPIQNITVNVSHAELHTILCVGSFSTKLIQHTLRNHEFLELLVVWKAPAMISFRCGSYISISRIHFSTQDVQCYRSPRNYAVKHILCNISYICMRPKGDLSRKLHWNGRWCLYWGWFTMELVIFTQRIVWIFTSTIQHLHMIGYLKFFFFFFYHMI